MIIDDYFLSEKSRNFIDQVILSKGDFLPYYLQKTFDNRDETYLGYIALSRPEERREGESWSTPYHQYFKQIFDDFIQKNNLNYTEILRCAVNLTYSQNKKSCEIHDDHNYPHHQLLVYCNDCDEEATTTVCAETDKVIVPKKYRGAYFKGAPHYMNYPKTGHRIVIVYTFKKEYL